MKKLLSLIVVSLLLTVNGYAACNNEFSYTWKMDGDYAKFEFKSTSDKSIILSSVRLVTPDNRTIKNLIADSKDVFPDSADLIIKAFGARKESYYIGDINKDMVKSASVLCRYYQKTVKKKIQSKPAKTKKTKSSSDWPTSIFFIIVFLAFFAMVTKASSVKKNKKTGHFEVVDEEVSGEPVPLKKTATKKNINEFEILSKFYNDYKSIDFTDSKSITSKANKKQTEMLVNIIMPNIQSLANNYPANTQVVMILIKLVEDNLVTEEKFIEVHKNLKEMKNIGEKVGLNQKLMTALHIMVG